MADRPPTTRPADRVVFIAGATGALGRAAASVFAEAGDRVVLSSGILGSIAAVEEDTFLVRIDDKTKIKVLKSAVAGLHGSTPETEQK